jgi:serine/threonine-protein kinase
VPDPVSAPSPFEPLALLGATLDGRYELVAHLATGGMGAVFQARHVHLRKDVAVKVLRPDLTSSAEIVERFRREAEIASALEHDNIVRVTDFGRAPEGHLFLTMELLTGESLFDRLRRDGFLRPEDAVPILWQVCAGLEAAHAVGIVHRDLKPENVYLARTPSGREVTKILDFGIAKIADSASESSTQAGMVVGTPEYLSPEQAMGAAVDARADVYAVGLIAWRMLAGRHPFKADGARSLLMMQATRPVPPLTEARPDLVAWPALVSAVSRACAKEAGDRHPSAAALRDELAASLGPAFVMPVAPTPTPTGHVTLSAVPPERRGATPVAATLAAEPRLRAGPAVARAIALGRVRLAAIRISRRAADGAAAIGGRALAAVRARPGRSAAAAAALALVIVLGAGLASQQGRAASQARAFLEERRAAEARAVLDAALARRPDDPELLLLRGRALHRIPGRAAEGVEAYAAALALAPLDAAAHEDLVADLGRERSLADRAARLLGDDAEGALPAILNAAQTAPGIRRLRALALARDLGEELRLDRVAAYGELLSDADCDVRRAAARRLGEIGDPAALVPLKRAAAATTTTRWLLGERIVPACGAAEASAAARRIQAARLPE